LFRNFSLRFDTPTGSKLFSRQSVSEQDKSLVWLLT